MACDSICEVHISGVLLAYIVSSALAAHQSVKYSFDIIGRQHVRQRVTDSSVMSTSVETTICGAVPCGFKSHEESNFSVIGKLSIIRTPAHRLTWKDWKSLKDGDGSTEGKFLLLVTVTPGPSSDLHRVEYTVLEKVPDKTTRLVPLIIDNVGDTLHGFVELGEMFSRSGILTEEAASSPSSDNPPSQIEHRLKEEANTKLKLINRIRELRAELAICGAD